MAVEHNTITDPNIHEPKGASAASVDTVLKADGTGSTSWSHPQENSLIAYGHLYTRGTDLATLSTIGTTPVLVPFSHAGVSNAMTLSQANASITVLKDGDYEINFNGSINTTDSTDAGSYVFRVNVDGATTFIESRVELSGTTDRCTVQAYGLISLTANDVITVEVDSDEAGNTDDLDLQVLSLSARLIRVT